MKQNDVSAGLDGGLFTSLAKAPKSAFKSCLKNHFTALHDN